MPLPELYENKILRDAEMPIQIMLNTWIAQDTPWKAGVQNHYPPGFLCHWHEHIELHYIVEGEACFTLNQTEFPVKAGDFIIINPNELHSAICTKDPYHARVIIFDIGDISPELAGNNFLFHSYVQGDSTAARLTEQIIQERQSEQFAYKQSCKALVTQLLVHMCRNYVKESLTPRDSAQRKKDLERLNAVLSYMESHYAQPITNSQLAKMVYLSDDRFGHLFRSSIGKPPMQYLNDLRLKKALGLLKASTDTVTQVAEAVGFRDYNNFGRLFRKRYGCTPHEVKSGKIALDEQV